MPQKLKLAASQSRTLPTLSETLADLEETTKRAASEGIDLLLFPEAYLGGYPRTCSFGAAVGGRTDEGREQFFQYFRSCVDLGDTPAGAGRDWGDWVDRKLEVAKDKKYRGDGTREFVERVARDTGVFIVTGVVERCGGSLYCAALYVCPRLGCIGKRRKVMPTGSERLVWAQGSPSTLRAVTTTIKGVKLTMATAICWENYMPLLRHSLYSQNVNLYLAPTADARDNWWPLIRTIGAEGRCFVLSANQCVKRKHLPGWITGKKDSTSTTARKSSASRPSDSDPMDGMPNGTAPRTGRRRSTFTVKEVKHDLVLPACDEAAEGAENGKPGEDPDQSYGSVADRGLRKSLVESADAAADMGLEYRSHSIANGPDQAVIDTPTPSATDSANDEEFVSRGGSCIAGPMGQALVEPLWEVEDGGLLIWDANFEDCERGRLDLDVAGSYSRDDCFKLTVEGLDLSPPP